MQEQRSRTVRLPLRGGCQCGAVRYAVEAAPLTLYACHCSECQKQSASAFGMSMLVRRHGLEVAWDALKAWQRPTPSGGTLVCHFCPACGTRLFHVGSDDEAIVSVKAGSLDDRSWLVPAGHIWTRSAQSWIELPAGTLRYEAQPPDMAPLVDAWRTMTTTWFVAA